MVLAVGFLFILVGWAWPAPEIRIPVPQTKLDEFVPAYQFQEFHTLEVAVPKERVYRAIKDVTAREILLFHTLTWIRRFGHPGPASIMNPPGDEPILDVALQTSFLLLAEDANREIVLGTLVVVPPGWRPKAKATPEDFKALHTPGFALAAMNFKVEDAGAGSCTVTTETRVYATDAAATRRFAAYWRMIYPGSALIRRMWLRAVKRRAEAKPD